MGWLRGQVDMVLDEHRHYMASRGKDPGSVGWRSVVWHHPTATSVTIAGAASLILGVSQIHPSAILVGILAMSAGALFFFGGARLDRLFRRGGVAPARSRGGQGEVQTEQADRVATGPGADQAEPRGKPWV